MNGLAVSLQVWPVIDVVQDCSLAVATFGLDALDSVHQSALGPDNTFFRERTGKVPPFLLVGSVLVVAITHKARRP